VTRFTDHLCTQLVSTSNYSAIVNLHTLQITAPNTLFQSAEPSLVVSWQRLLTVEILQLHAVTSLLSGEYPITELSTHSLPYRTASQIQSQSYFTAGGLQHQFVLAPTPLRLTNRDFLFSCLSSVYCQQPWLVFIVVFLVPSGEFQNSTLNQAVTAYNISARTT
jgi:hypothetical protein